jgi:hypothetical protein
VPPETVHGLLPLDLPINIADEFNACSQDAAAVVVRDGTWLHRLLFGFSTQQDMRSSPPHRSKKKHEGNSMQEYVPHTHGKAKSRISDLDPRLLLMRIIHHGHVCSGSQSAPKILVPWKAVVCDKDKDKAHVHVL